MEVSHKVDDNSQNLEGNLDEVNDNDLVMRAR